MSVSLYLDHPHERVVDTPWRGPVTRARQQRLLACYLLVCAIGVAPALLGAAPFLEAAGLGLIFPGAGFLSSSGFALLGMPASWVLFFAAVFLWFATGNVLLPGLVWIGAAMVAGLVADPSLPSYAWPVAGGLLLAFCAGVAFRNAHVRKVKFARRAAREAFLPTAMTDLSMTLAARPSETEREIDEAGLSAMRYALDRALQPISGFGGFDRIDQFQPAAWRYQINHLGIGLSAIQANYTPNFHGYLSTAQTNLIEKYLDPRVWRYWVLESMWGHLNFSNFDPAAKDNIMLTGWFGMQIAQYMRTTGDMRYAQPGSLPFRLNARTVWHHDIHTLFRSVIENLDAQAFCLYPCEPNWIYPICNHYALAGLTSYDSIFGTDHVVRVRDRWFHMLDTEFTDESGSLVGLRSSLTGLRFPFPSGEAAFADFTNVFAPERAKRMWAIARTELAKTIGPGARGDIRLKLPGAGIDFGNYRRNHSLAYAVISCSAGEMGDIEILEAARNAMYEDGDPKVEGGVLRFMNASNMANVRFMRGQLARRDDFARSLITKPADAIRNGPLLTGADYPAVLVTKARSTDGASLDLVLQPGTLPGRRELRLERLHAMRSYAVRGADEIIRFKADENGTARFELILKSRTSVTVEPDLGR